MSLPLPHGGDGDDVGTGVRSTATRCNRTCKTVPDGDGGNVAAWP